MTVKLYRAKYVPLFVFQLILMVLYFIFVRYGEAQDYKLKGFEDTHVMIFVGFGFLMTFLKKYSYSALGFNWLLAALIIQWAVLCQAFFTMKDNKIYVSKKSMLEADIMSATVLITFGAVLGLASGVQLIVIGIIETVIGCLNIWLVGEVFKAADVGGSIAIHAFGAYFGLGVSLGLKIWVNKPETQPESSQSQANPEADLNGPTYVSDVTAMIGSLFLWIYWPSFNSALTSTEGEYERAIMNTYLAIAASAVTAFVMSSIVSEHEAKFDMVHIQNSTLAGGVAVGSVCNMHIGAGGAIAIGMGAGIISVLGYRFLTPKIAKYGILDTCGVHNLHGMPGVLSGILSIICAAAISKNKYGSEISSMFTAMNTDGTGRSELDQALYQFIALVVTLGLSFVSGIFTGLVVQLPFFEKVKTAERYNDDVNWELPK